MLNDNQAADQEVKDLSAAELKQLLDDGKAILVDVREPWEYIETRIPGAHLVPLQGFDPAKVPQEEGKITVLHCLAGKRSRTAGEILLNAGWDEVSHLADGILAWEGADFPILEGEVIDGEAAAE